MPSENNIAMGIKKNTLGLVKKLLCSIMAYVCVDHNGLNGILKKKMIIFWNRPNYDIEYF